jgi:D-alanyl-D-alanine carboxypeptidase
MVECGVMVHKVAFLKILFGIVLMLVCIGTVAYGGYLLYTSTKEERALRDEVASLRAELTDKNNAISEYEAQHEALNEALGLTKEGAAELMAQLTEEQERNDAFERQIKQLSGTVKELDKLSKLDPELLQKYSKVFFLNEHYEPPRLRAIDQEFVFRTNEPEYIHAQVEPFLEDLLEDAQEDGIELRVLSGYRSFDEQRDLKGAYTVQYGSGANTFSADQGFSEHQLGTAVDFTTPELNGGLAGFQNTEAYAWLLGHAHRYGFILSYPENNQYYIFEPWHWRFVGEDLADDLHDDNKNFYDLDQREIDAYLISIFD